MAIPSASVDDWVIVVEALYPYESTNARGHSVIVQPGEMYFLIRDIDEEWWFVGRSLNDEDGFYFPHSYGKVVQRQKHRLMERNSMAMSMDSDTLADNPVQRLSTFGGGGGGGIGSIKRRSYQLATITDDQLAIYDNPAALNAHGAGASDQRGSFAGSSLIRRKPRAPSFKLPDPKRISRSIPVDLNFVHSIQSDKEDGGGRLVYGDPRRVAETVLFESRENGLTDESESPLGDHYAQSNSGDGPIYANLKPIGAKELPPLPVPGSKPITLLHDGWAEYVDRNNRRYFYNASLKKAMWKPPRLTADLNGNKRGTAHGSVSSGDELDTSFVSDDGDPFSGLRDPTLTTSIAWTGDSSLECGVASKDSTLEHSVILGSCPPIDIRTLSAKKHAESAATEANGHQKPQDSREVDLYAYSEDLANIATKIRLSADEQSPTSDNASAGFPNKNLQPGQHQAQNCIRSGVLNRCKYMEAGKRVKKQWLPCFVYLTNAHLLFYKDEKAAEKKGNQYPTPLGVCDLRGAKLRWLEGDLSRRKNVFQVQLLDVTVYLFHAESQPEIVAWYDDLRRVIDHLPVPDCYPAPSIESSPTRFSLRKNHSSKNVPPPELPKQQVALANATKDSDKRKSVSTPHSPVLQSATMDMSDQVPQRETILERLRKFFRSRPSVEALKERGIYKPEPVFGSSLVDICRREKSTVPKFIQTCTELIEEKGLNADGLYRINGNLSQVQRIRCQVDQEKYGSLLNETDVHVLTGALKLFFRELQEPAFPTSSTKDFLNAIKLQNAKQRWKAFSELILKLPRPHHDTLDHLFRHLLNVAKNSNKNRMQIHNLAIVFGPSLFSSNPSAKTPAELSKQKATKKKSEVKTSFKEPSNAAASESKSSQRPESSTNADVTHSNSQLAFTMILQGQIVEYLLKEHGKFFKSSDVQ